MMYPTTDFILQLHDEVIHQSCGLAGGRDIGQLESILDHIQNDEYYPRFEDKLDI